jgi:hypothetical protein
LAKVNAKRIVQNSLYSFEEKSHQVFSHDLRVFIYGRDVSSWLKGELAITYGNRESYNTVTLELANPQNLWKLTYDNLDGKWRTAVGEYNESAKKEIFQHKNQKYNNPYFTLVTKSTNLGTAKGEKPLTLAKAMGDSKFAPPEDLQERRYRLAVNDCIFGRHDPMRVFMRNPIQVWGNEGMWVEVFCGFVQDHPITSNFVNGESTLRITGYDIRQLLKKMRVQMNAYRHGNDVSPYFSSGFFADFRRPSFANHPFPQMSLEKTIKNLILGTSDPEDDIPAFQLGGVGEFKIGNIVCYNPSKPNGEDGKESLLERWHLLTLFGCNKVPFPSSSDDLWLTTPEMINIGKHTIYTPDKYIYGPEGRYLHFLLPWEGTGAGALVQSTIDVNIQGVEWTTRWDIIREFASKLDFQVNVSPSGDLLVEFPMYGFTPAAFTKAGPKPFKAKRKQGEAIYDPPKGMEKLFIFDKHQIEETMSDEAEDFPTVLQVDGGMASQHQEVKAGDPQIANYRSFVYSPVLCARYGVISEQVMIPFAGQKLGDLSGGSEAKILIRLPKLGAIEFMRRMADASHWEGSVVFRPFLFPNRPVWLRRSSRMGTITSVSHRWTIGKSASTSFSCNMLMAERYNPETKEISYRLPTGASDLPISYATIWDANLTGTAQSAVFTDTGKDTPSNVANDGSKGSTGSGSVLPTPVDLASDTLLYPAFKQALQQTLNEAAKQGLKVVVNNAFRSSKEQADLMKKKSKYPEVAEPWRSLHQYGLAADLNIEGNNKEDYYKLADIARQYGLRWGGNFTTSFDYVHFDWGFNIKGSKCQEIMKSTPINFDDKNPGATGIKRVWAFLDGGETKTSSATPEQGTKSSAADLAQNMTKKSTGTETISPAPACEGQELQKSGLSEFKG